MIPVTIPSAFDARRVQPGHFWLFLHSRSDPASGAAYAEVAAYERAYPAERILIVTVPDQPSVAEHIEKALGLRRDVPQIALLEEGRVAWHTSGENVSMANMEMARLPAL